MFTTFLLAFLVQASSAPPVNVDVTKLTLSPAKAVVELDTGKLKGDPARLAWNTDGTLYLRAVEVDRWLNERARHYLIALPSPAPASAESEPIWANSYWFWKCDRTAPGDATLKIEVESRKQPVRSTSAPRGADIAGMGGDRPVGAGGDTMPTGSAVDAAMGAQAAATTTLRVKGQVVGEWVNQQPQPGQRFGWAPAPMGAAVFVDARKRLMLLDREGRTREVPGATEAVLPAWSPDGKQIAYLQKKDKKKYVLMVLDVTQ